MNFVGQDNPLLKETQDALANVTSSSSSSTSKQQFKENGGDDDDDDDDDEEEEEREEGSVHDDSDKWSPHGDNLLKVCDNKNIIYFNPFARLTAD